MFKSASGAKRQDTVKADPRKVKCTEAELKDCIRENCNMLFAKQKEISFQDFIEIRAILRNDLWHYEFHNFEPEDGKITIEEFLSSAIKNVVG